MNGLPFVIVLLPPSDMGCGVAVVALNRDGSLNAARNFLLTYRPTPAAQKSYAAELVQILGCQVLELRD